MGNQTIVLYVVSAALLVFYMMRRRSRHVAGRLTETQPKGREGDEGLSSVRRGNRMSRDEESRLARQVVAQWLRRTPSTWRPWPGRFFTRFRTT